MKKACITLTALTLLLNACGSTEQQTSVLPKNGLQLFLKSQNAIVSAELLKQQGWTSIQAIEQGNVIEGQHTFAPQAPFSFNGGTIKGYLAGPRSTNFDLSLVRFDVEQAEWVIVKSATSSNSKESLKAKVSKGIYTFIVSSKAGSGRFMLHYKLNTNDVSDQPPMADFDVSKNGLRVTFTDQSTDDKGIRSWKWDLGNGTISEQQNPTVNYRAKGTYTVKLTVTDTSGQTHSISKSIQVSKNGNGGDDKAPNAAFDVLRKGLRVQFTDQSTDDKGIRSWKWDLGNGEDSTDQNPIVNYRARGRYTIKLTVTDTKGQTNTASKTFEVAKNINDGGPTNKAPVASFHFQVDQLKVNFTDSSKDSDGRVVKWDWNFGNGQTSSRQNPSVIYRRDGTYDVRLTVTDDKGATHSNNQQVTVKKDNPTPIKAIYDPVTKSNINEVLRISNDRTVILDFGATWCGPCKRLKPLIKAKAKKDKGKWVLGLIDVDQSPGLKNKYNIRGYPTLISFKNGREASRHKTGLSGWERWVNNQIR